MKNQKQSTAGRRIKRLISVNKSTDERLKRLRHEHDISQWGFIRRAIDEALDRFDGTQKDKV